MPLTRRVQVYINPAASDALDAIMETLETGQTKAIEAALLGYAEDHGCYPTAIERSADVGTVMDAFTEKYAANLASSQPDTKLDRSTERINEEFEEHRREVREQISRGASALPDRINAPQTSLDAVGPTVESGRGKASVETVNLPLKRDKIVPLPKPGKRK